MTRFALDDVALREWCCCDVENIKYENKTEINGCDDESFFFMFYF